MPKMAIPKKIFFLAVFFSALFTAGGEELLSIAEETSSPVAAEEIPAPGVQKFSFPSGEELPSFHEWINNVSSLLGMALDEVFESFGVPRRVFSARGDEPWQDDVVFEYADGFSLFWHKDKVWQLRFGPGFRIMSRDVGMGSSREGIAAVLGKPFHEEEDWLLYHFAGHGYPLRVRLFFGKAGLEDIYIYRGDF